MNNYFSKDMMNMIDLVAIVPYFITLATIVAEKVNFIFIVLSVFFFFLTCFRESKIFALKATTGLHISTTSCIY